MRPNRKAILSCHAFRGKVHILFQSRRGVEEDAFVVAQHHIAVVVVGRAGKGALAEQGVDVAVHRAVDFELRERIGPVAGDLAAAKSVGRGFIGFGLDIVHAHHLAYI